MADPQQEQREQQKKWGQIVAKAWTDENFKKRLLADPHAVLKEHGVQVPQGLQLKVLEDTGSVRHLILPPKPDASELSEDDLATVAGGFTCDQMDLCTRKGRCYD